MGAAPWRTHFCCDTDNKQYVDLMSQAQLQHTTHYSEMRKRKVRHSSVFHLLSHSVSLVLTYCNYQIVFFRDATHSSGVQ